MAIVQQYRPVRCSCARGHRGEHQGYGRHIKRRLKIALIYDVRAKGDMEHVGNQADMLIPCDFTSQSASCRRSALHG